MPIEPKSKTTSRAFNKTEIAAAFANAAPDAKPTGIDWSKAIVTPGGGVKETLSQIRRTRGKNKNPTKEQVAIRLDPEVLAAFRAGGRGWQTRVNAALREWLGANPQAIPKALPKDGA